MSFTNYTFYPYNMLKFTKTYSLIRARYMNFGFFDDLNNEYVITTPETPLPWINYLGSQDFFRLISNTSGGYCFYKDAKLMRLTRYRYNNSPMDSNGHYFYIKILTDADTVSAIPYLRVQRTVSMLCRRYLYLFMRTASSQESR